MYSDIITSYPCFKLHVGGSNLQRIISHPSNEIRYDENKTTLINAHGTNIRHSCSMQLS